MTKLKAIFTMLLCLGLLLTPMPASFATGTLSEIEDPTAAEDAVIPHHAGYSCRAGSHRRGIRISHYPLENARDLESIR